MENIKCAGPQLRTPPGGYPLSVRVNRIGRLLDSYDTAAQVTAE